MTKASHARVAPRLPAKSVDFNALHNACLKGDDAAKAFADNLNEVKPRKLAKGEKLVDAAPDKGTPIPAPTPSAAA